METEFKFFSNNPEQIFHTKTRRVPGLELITGLTDGEATLKSFFSSIRGFPFREVTGGRGGHTGSYIRMQKIPLGRSGDNGCSKVQKLLQRFVGICTEWFNKASIQRTWNMR